MHQQDATVYTAPHIAGSPGHIIVMQYNTMVHGSRVAGFPADLIITQRHTIVFTALLKLLALQAIHDQSLFSGIQLVNAIVSFALALRAII